MEFEDPSLRSREKRPFLRKGAGLKRFFKNVDIDSHFQFRKAAANNCNNDEDDGTCQSQSFAQTTHPPLHAVLKSVDSPKRHLNVRFSNAVTHTHSTEEIEEDKENLNPNSVTSSRWGDEGSASGEAEFEDEGGSSEVDSSNDWETDTEQETEDGAEAEVETDSLIELNESAVFEVFEALSQAKAQKELFPASWENPTNTTSLRHQSTSKINFMDVHSWIRESADTTRADFMRKVERVPTDVEDKITGQLKFSGRSMPLENITNTLSRRVQGSKKPENGILPARILQLESEIEKNCEKNKELRQLSESLKKDSGYLSQEKDKFETLRTKELEMIAELKERLRADRAQIGQSNQELIAGKIFGKQQTQELASLRAQVTLLRKDFKVRKSRWDCSTRIFKATIEDLRRENNELEKAIAEAKAIKARRHLNSRVQNRSMKKKIPATTSANSEMPVPVSSHVKSVALTISKATVPDLSHSDCLRNTLLEKTGSEGVGDGKKELRRDEFGTVRVLSPSGDCLEIRYANGDVKDLSELDSKGITKYYFQEAQSWEIIHSDGTQVLQFGTGEVQTKLPNGVCEIQYASGVTRRLFPDGTDECLFPDKTIVRTQSDGDRELHLPNGQVEFHSKNLKIRIYPDGTEKVLYSNGSTLTRYASGRQRFRDPSGQIVYDRLESEKGHLNLSQTTTSQNVTS